jgi:hypothetical protein
MNSTTRVVACTLALVSSGAARAAEREDGTVPSPVVQETLKEYLAALISARSQIIDLKYIRPDENGDNAGWGVNYKWKTSRDTPRLGPEGKEEANQHYVLRKLSYDLDIQGTYAFSDTTNNADLSTIKAAVRLERADFGKLNPDEAVGERFQECLLLTPAPTADAEQRREVDRQREKCEIDSRIDALVRNEDSASYYGLDFHGGVEGNQDYSDSRTLFGLTGVYAFQPKRALEDYNVLDFPFRLVRSAFSTAKVSGYTAPFPSLLLSVERLDASDDEVRTALTSKETFTRGKAEIAFNTILASIDEQVLRFTVSYRYFHEFSAPRTIKDADLDHFDYLNATLRFPAKVLPFVQSDDFELYVAYTTGQLPFDQSSDKAFEVGFSTNFKWVADMLAQ